QELQVRMLRETDDRIRKIVEQVAEAKSLQLVVDAQLVWYGGLDITEDVLKKLPQ
ncbi:MAG: OmpH family outer membrane protein, partial [Armatimonadetes bacterium]|nr:OmpH family outer membrane protein [Armatimonadota bacterium]